MGSTAPEPPVQRASPNASGRASIATRRRVLAMHGGSQTAPGTAQPSIGVRPPGFTAFIVNCELRRVMAGSSASWFM